MSEVAEAWVTLATNDSYAMGALVLARSLRRVNTTRQIVVMITPGVSGAMRDVLANAFDVVTEVNILDSEDAAHLALLDRPELGITFTKIHCWKLTQFTKCVFLDADTLIIQNSDELFDREELSAAPDPGWPDCFNSGVFVFKPSLDTYNNINRFAVSHGSFDGGDQGLLNMYFSSWSQAGASHRLPFIYNMVATASYSYLPAYKVFGKDVKIVHFIGQEKPWLIYYDTSTGLVRAPGGQEHMQELLQAWWNIFRSEVHPTLSPEMGGGQTQSATVVEQVQASFSHIFLSAEPSASQFSFQPPPNYHPPPPTHHPPPPSQHPPSSHHEPQNEQQTQHHSSPESNQQSNDPPHPPHVEQPPPPPPEPTLLVAIQRYPPDHFWREPPPPPPLIPEYIPPPPPPRSSPEHSITPPPPPTPNNPESQTPNAQIPTDGGSGSPQADHSGSNNSSNDASSQQNNGPRENFNDSTKQPLKEEKRRRKKRSKPKGIAAVYAKMSLEGGKPIEQIEYEDQMRKMAWEQGHIDYMGRDSFDNIMKRIQTSMAQTSVQKPPRKQTPPKQEAAAPPPPVVNPEPPKQETTAPPPPVVTPADPPKQEATAPPPPVATPDPPKQEPVPVPQPPPKEEAVLATAQPPKEEPTPKSQPTPASKVVPEQQPVKQVQVPVVEPPIVASIAKQAKSAPPAPEKSTKEEEEADRKALEARQAVEKKLVEQRKVAEQNLEAEKQAAAAAAAAAASKAPAAVKAEEPKAPPRKDSQTNPALGQAAMPYGMGLGILGAAMVVVFAIYAAYSPASLFL